MEGSISHSFLPSLTNPQSTAISDDEYDDLQQGSLHGRLEDELSGDECTTEGEGLTEDDQEDVERPTRRQILPREMIEEETVSSEHSEERLMEEDEFTGRHDGRKIRVQGGVIDGRHLEDDLSEEEESDDGNDEIIEGDEEVEIVVDDEEEREQSDGVGYEVDDGGDIDGDIVEESDMEEYRRERTQTDEEDEGDKDEGVEDLKLIKNKSSGMIDGLKKGQITTTNLVDSRPGSALLMSSALTEGTLNSTVPIYSGIQYGKGYQYTKGDSSHGTFSQNQQNVNTKGRFSMLIQKSPILSSTTAPMKKTIQTSPQESRYPWSTIRGDNGVLPFHQFNESNSHLQQMMGSHSSPYFVSNLASHSPSSTTTPIKTQFQQGLHQVVNPLTTVNNTVQQFTISPSIARSQTSNPYRTVLTSTPSSFTSRTNPSTVTTTVSHNIVRPTDNASNPIQRIVTAPQPPTIISPPSSSLRIHEFGPSLTTTSATVFGHPPLSDRSSLIVQTSTADAKPFQVPLPTSVTQQPTKNVIQGAVSSPSPSTAVCRNITTPPKNSEPIFNFIRQPTYYKNQTTTQPMSSMISATKTSQIPFKFPTPNECYATPQVPRISMSIPEDAPLSVSYHPFNGVHRFESTQPVSNTWRKTITAPDHRELPPQSILQTMIQSRGTENSVHRYTTTATSTTHAHAPHVPYPILNPTYRSGIVTPSWVPPQHSTPSQRPWYLQTLYPHLRFSKNGISTNTVTTQPVAKSVTSTVVRNAPLVTSTPSASSFLALERDGEKGKKHHRRHKHRKHHKKHHRSFHSDETLPYANSTAKENPHRPSSMSSGWVSIQTFFRNLVGA